MASGLDVHRGSPQALDRTGHARMPPKRATLQQRWRKLTKRVRMFKESSLVLSKTSGHKFNEEESMQKLIEDNVQTLFPGLIFLKSRFLKMIRRNKPDTIAFDTNRNTFVAIEYKNKLGRGAMSQVEAYLRHMEAHRAELVMEHAMGMNCNPRSRQSFCWEEMYGIIMAPEFSKYQIAVVRKDLAVELHKISMYNEHVVLERVGGGHQETPLGRTVPLSNSVQSKSEQMDRLYETIRTRLLAEFPSAKVNEMPKTYNGFRLPGSRGYFCKIQVLKQKIQLHYSDKRAKLELEPSEFVSDRNQSEIRSEAEFERALTILKGLYGDDGNRQKDQLSENTLYGIRPHVPMNLEPVATTPRLKKIWELFKNVEVEDEKLLTKADIAEIEQSLKNAKEGDFKTQEQMVKLYGLDD